MANPYMEHLSSRHPAQFTCKKGTLNVRPPKVFLVHIASYVWLYSMSSRSMKILTKNIRFRCVKLTIVMHPECFGVLSSGPSGEPSSKDNLSEVGKGVRQVAQLLSPTLLRKSTTHFSWVRRRSLEHPYASMPIFCLDLPSPWEQRHKSTYEAMLR
jgi:hypothetical protein